MVSTTIISDLRIKPFSFKLLINVSCEIGNRIQFLENISYPLPLQGSFEIQ